MTEAVASPCIGVCTLDRRSVCSGCGRHIDEISSWARLTEGQRATVVARARARLAQPAHGIDRPSLPSASGEPQ